MGIGIKAIRKAERTNRILAVVLSFSMLAALLGGCGNGTASGNDNTENASLNMNESGQGNMQASEGTAMGRYVEELIDLSDRIGYASQIFQMDNGELLISDYINTFLVSADNGATWEAETEERSWKTPLSERDSISNMAIGADNTVAVIYDAQSASPSEEDYNPFNMERELMIVKPDGTQILADISLTEDDECFRMVRIYMK